MILHNLEQSPITPVTLATLWMVLLPEPVRRTLGGVKTCLLAIVSPALVVSYIILIFIFELYKANI